MKINFKKMCMEHSFMFIFLLKCIKLAAFESEDEYLNQILREFGELSVMEENQFISENIHNKSDIALLIFKVKDASFCVPLFIFNKEDADFLNEKPSYAVESKENDSQNLLLKTLIEILTKSDLNIFPEKGTSNLQKNILLDFIIEYINKIDEMFSESGCDIVFVKHTIGSEASEINMKSLSGEFEKKEYFDIKKQEISDFFSDVLNEILLKTLNQYFQFLGLNAVEYYNQQINQAIDMVFGVSISPGNLLEIFKNPKDIFQREEIKNIIEFLYIFVELIPQELFLQINTILEDTYNEFIREEPDKTLEEKKIIAGNHIRDIFCNEILSNKDNPISIVLRQQIACFFSFVTHGTLEHTDEISEIFYESFSNMGFYQNLLHNLMKLYIFAWGVLTS
ncbi:hypothetical protein CWI38_0447p0010 [Hamiltosporidium tvaerminnensis]|uniref:Uncharacterized protein n=1 Tax=Hamiltosporidium tvaerminnensis TaxID=1176355 RepID=A0A4Q9LX85_9MICR|nr:hypothetical protein CWI38_0447p0010 [Hamiltosporidium tvaerminnensis]